MMLDGADVLRSFSSGYKSTLILKLYKYHLEPVHSAVEGEVLAGGDHHHGVVQLLVKEGGPGP